MRCLLLGIVLLGPACVTVCSGGEPASALAEQVAAAEVLEGLREFYRRTARPDGSFAPGIDPDYLGMSDSAYSDLATVTYACTVHQTFGWTLPHERQTVEFLRSRQREDGTFFNVAGTVDPDSTEGRVYNTTQGLVALRALRSRPRHDPLPVFEQILQGDHKTLPPYSTSFFPLAYLCYGQPIPEQADRGIRALMVQDEDGYLNDHIAATFHASHYYRLIGEPTPKAREMVARTLRDQKRDGSWLRNMPSRDRHATFDAVFTLRHEGQGRADCQAAIERAARWALSCHNPDGGFGHFPGSTSDADAVYFQVGTLVMAGFLKPADPLPPDPHLLSWGHLMPVRPVRSGPERLALRLPEPTAAVAFSPDSRTLATGSADGVARLWDARTGDEVAELSGHADSVADVAFAPGGKLLATGSYDRTARIWALATGETAQVLDGHRGAVLSVAFSPDGNLLATASIDRTVRLWNPATGELRGTLDGHRSWVHSVAFSPDGRQLASGSSDGTVVVWSMADQSPRQTLRATPAEVRSVAWSPDGTAVAAGSRYGQVKVWNATTWTERSSFKAHDDDVWSVTFSADGKALLSGDGGWNRPGSVKIWSVPDLRAIGRLRHTGEVLSIATSPDGKSVAAGGHDRIVRVWDFRNAP